MGDSSPFPCLFPIVGFWIFRLAGDMIQRASTPSPLFLGQFFIRDDFYHFVNLLSKQKLRLKQSQFYSFRHGINRDCVQTKSSDTVSVSCRRNSAYQFWIILRDKKCAGAEYSNPSVLPNKI